MTVSWKVARSGDWDDPHRWLGGIPSASEDVVIDAVGAYTAHITTAASARTLRVSGQGVVVEEAASGVLSVGGRITVEGGATLALLGANPDLAHGVSVSDATLHLGGTAALGSARLTVAGASTLLLDGPFDFAGHASLGSEDVSGLIRILPENDADITFSGALTIASDLMFGVDDFPTSYADITFAPRRATVIGNYTLEVGTGKTLVLASRAGAALFDASSGGPTLGLKLDFAGRIDLAGYSLSVGRIATDDYSFIYSGTRATLTFATPGSDIRGSVLGRIGIVIDADTALSGDLDLKGRGGIVIGNGVDVELGRVETSHHGALTVGDDTHVRAGSLNIGMSVALGARTSLNADSLSVRNDLEVGAGAAVTVDGTHDRSGFLYVAGEVVLAEGSALSIENGTLTHLTGSGTISFDGNRRGFENTPTLSVGSADGFTGALTIKDGNAQLDLAGSDLASLSLEKSTTQIQGIGQISFDLGMAEAQLTFTDLTLVGKITATGETAMFGHSLLLDPAAHSSFAGATVSMVTAVTVGSTRAADLLSQASSSYFQSLDLNGHDAELNSARGQIINTARQAVTLTVRGDTFPDSVLVLGDRLSLVLEGSGYTIAGTPTAVEIVESGTVNVRFVGASLALADTAAVAIGLDGFQRETPRISGFDANDSIHLLKEADYVTDYRMRYDARAEAVLVDLTYRNGGVTATQTLYIDGEHTIDDFAIRKMGHDIVVTLREAAWLAPLGDDVFEMGTAAHAGSPDHHAAPLPPVDLAVFA